MSSIKWCWHEVLLLRIYLRKCWWQQGSRPSLLILIIWFSRVIDIRILMLRMVKAWVFHQYRSLYFIYYYFIMFGVVIHTHMLSDVSFWLGSYSSLIAWIYQLWLHHCQLFLMFMFLRIWLTMGSSRQVFLRYLPILFSQWEATIAFVAIISIGYMLLKFILWDWNCWYILLILYILRLIWFNLYTRLCAIVLECLFWLRLFSTNRSTRILMLNDNYIISFWLTLKWNSIKTLLLTFIVFPIISECNLVVILLLVTKLLILLKRLVLSWLFYIYVILRAICKDGIPPVLSLIITWWW